MKYFSKTGFPIADPKTGELIGKNKDLYCADKLCRDMHWRNYTNTASTFDASIGGPIQDTVLVPYGGYTVVRIQTDNPGKASLPASKQCGRFSDTLNWPELA